MTADPSKWLVPDQTALVENARSEKSSSMTWDWQDSNNHTHCIPIASRTDSRSGSTTTDLAAEFSIAIAGSFSPWPVTVTTNVEFFGISPLALLFTMPAIPAADAGSTNMPSVLASILWASSISSSVTESIVPEDSSEASMASCQLAGFLS